MGNGDTAIDEEGRETGQSQEPIEDVWTTIGVKIDECKAANEELETDNRQWTTFLVDIREYLWSHSYQKPLEGSPVVIDGNTYRLQRAPGRFW